MHTVLAALRVVQSRPALLRHPDVATIATNDGSEEPLGVDEIDALCEAWNTGTLEVTVVNRGGVPSIYTNAPGGKELAGGPVLGSRSPPH